MQVSLGSLDKLGLVEILSWYCLRILSVLVHLYTHCAGVAVGYRDCREDGRFAEAGVESASDPRDL
jgi:hypothetical protein